MERINSSGMRGQKSQDARRKVSGQARTDASLLRMLIKTTDYLDHFARFKRKENVEAVERLLSAHKELAKFERAQLGMSNLHELPYSERAKRIKNKIYGALLISSCFHTNRLSMLRYGRRSKDAHPQPDGQDHRRRVAGAVG